MVDTLSLVVPLGLKTLLPGAKRSAFIAMCLVESKGDKTDIFKSIRHPAAQSWTPTFLIPPKHNYWPPICDAKASMTAFGQHSMVPPFYANQASVAPHPRTTREQPLSPHLFQVQDQNPCLEPIWHDNKIRAKALLRPIPNVFVFCLRPV